MIFDRGGCGEAAGGLWPAADVERSVSGVEQRDICGSKWRLRRPADGQFGGRSRRGRLGFQSSAFDKQKMYCLPWGS